MKSRIKCIAMAGLALFVIGYAGMCWGSFWPTKTVEGFIAHAYQGRYAEADGMLTSPSSMVLGEDGSLRIQDANGATFQVPSELLPFMAGRVNPDLRPDRTIMDRIAGRYTFSMAATGPNPTQALGHAAIVLNCTALRGNVSIDSVEKID